MFEVKQLCGQLCIGKQGENLARIVYFEEPALWKELFGDGKCELLHQRNGDEAPYPVALEVEDGKVCWKITNADTAVIGEGKCELYYFVDGVIVKSKIWTTTVLPSLGENIIEPPEPQQGWVDQVLGAAEEVKDATTHQPMIGENKNWFVWDAETQEYVDTGVLAEGTVGDSVPDWAKEPTKPTYNAGEVGAYSKSEVDVKINSINNDIDEVENQTKIIKSDVEGLQHQINEEAHFRGYLSTNAKIQALEATPNDFAYSAESGTKWVYDAENGWQDTKILVPDQLTPASDALPLINGTASPGTATEYARGDHRHPTDTTRVGVDEFNELKSDIETTLDTIIEIQNTLIGGGSE